MNSYEKAVSLRKDGYSYRFISQTLGIGKGTLSYWLRNIPYAPNKFTLEAIGKAHAKSGASKTNKKKQTIKSAYKVAKLDIGKIDKRDLFILGIGLYIGEGTKVNDQIRFVNSDPTVIKAMVTWFRSICGVADEQFLARIHCYPDTDIVKATKHWQEVSGLPSGCFTKPYIDVRSQKSQLRKGKLPFGTLHLTIRSNGKKEFGVLLSRKITAWMEILLKQAGIV